MKIKSADAYDYEDWNFEPKGGCVDDFERPTHSRLLGPSGHPLPYEEFKFGFQPAGSKRPVPQARWNNRSIRKAFGK